MSSVSAALTVSCIQQAVCLCGGSGFISSLRAVGGGNTMCGKDFSEWVRKHTKCKT